MSPAAGPDPRGWWHYSDVEDWGVGEDVRWAGVEAVVGVAAALGVPLPSVGWFAAESAAERAYADAHGGDRSAWDGWATPAPCTVAVSPGRVALDRDADPTAPAVVEAIEHAVTLLAVTATPTNKEAT